MADNRRGNNLGVLIFSVIIHIQTDQFSPREDRLAPASAPALEVNGGAVKQILLPSQVIILHRNLHDGTGNLPHLI